MTAGLLLLLVAGSVGFIKSQEGSEPAVSGAEGKRASGYPVRIALYPIRIALTGTGPLQFELRPKGSNQLHQLSLAPATTQSSKPELDSAESQAADGSVTFRSVRLADKKPLAGGVSLQFIRLNYNLPGVGGDPDVIDVQKVFRANGVDKGRVGLRIVNDTTILVKSDDIISLMGDDLGPQVIASLEASKLANGYADFDTLRAAGVDLRYDAVHDKVLVITGAS